jgi:hypothetical protein
MDWVLLLNNDTIFQGRHTKLLGVAADVAYPRQELPQPSMVYLQEWIQMHGECRAANQDSIL